MSVIADRHTGVAQTANTCLIVNDIAWLSWDILGVTAM